MKWHIVLAGLALGALTLPTHAKPSPGDAKQAAAVQHDALRLAATTKRRGGVSTSTADVDGDGTADVVVKSPPKPKRKPLRRVRRHR